jgi:hypothetical protein
MSTYYLIALRILQNSYSDRVCVCGYVNRSIFNIEYSIFKPRFRSKNPIRNRGIKSRGEKRDGIGKPTEGFGVYAMFASLFPFISLCPSPFLSLSSFTPLNSEIDSGYPCVRCPFRLPAFMENLPPLTSSLYVIVLFLEFPRTHH